MHRPCGASSSTAGRRECRLTDGHSPYGSRRCRARRLAENSAQSTAKSSKHDAPRSPADGFCVRGQDPAFDRTMAPRRDRPGCSRASWFYLAGGTGDGAQPAPESPVGLVEDLVWTSQLRSKASASSRAQDCCIRIQGRRTSHRGYDLFLRWRRFLADDILSAIQAVKSEDSILPRLDSDPRRPVRQLRLRISCDVLMVRLKAHCPVIYFTRLFIRPGKIGVTSGPDTIQSRMRTQPR